MGLLTVLKKLKQKERETRVLLLGLDNAGKTTILKRINGEPIDEISPTLGFNIKTMEHMGYKLNIWDVGGQKSIRSYWRNYFEQTDGLIWVIDAADPHRLKECRDELYTLLKEERLAGCSVLIFANKQDLPSALSLDEIADQLDLRSKTTHHWHIEACSAVSGQNLLQGMNWIVKDIASRIYLMDLDG
ncbi:ADP-ribosylation factor family-domain-containing protein [Gorgonomyces haynaldii]|nr:ADP-ribosylation factor family-domain-containing protein [Gorgonomyces haynaldii]